MIVLPSTPGLRRAQLAAGGLLLCVLAVTASRWYEERVVDEAGDSALADVLLGARR